MSLILTLHARYEAAWVEYHALEDAEIKAAAVAAADHTATEKRSLKLDIGSAMRVNQEEIDSLRLAVLYQVPEDDHEAAVLAFHVHTAFAITDSFERPEGNDPDRLAFEAGLDTLLDYLFGKVATDGEGAQLRHLEEIVQKKRRLRCAIELPELLRRAT